MVLQYLGEIDPYSLLVSAPQVCKQWRKVCETYVDAPMDLSWASKGAAHDRRNPVTDDGLIAMAKRFRSFNMLDVEGANDLSDVGVTSFVKGQSLPLERVNLSFCTKLTDESVKAVAEGCPGLRELSLRQCYQVTDHGIEALARGCRGLRTLQLEHCSTISDYAIVTVARQCRQLEYLGLEHCSHITDASAIALGTHCPNLFVIRLDVCYNITRAGIEALAAGCPLLAEMNLEGVEHVTDNCLRAISSGLKSLHSINLNNCTRVSDAGAEVLARGCKMLTSMSLQYCNRLTALGHGMLAAASPQLRVLNLSGDRYYNTSVHDASLAHFASHCPMLVDVDLSFCEKISDEGLAMMIKGCPRLQPDNLLSNRKGPLFAAAVAQRIRIAKSGGGGRGGR